MATLLTIDTTPLAINPAYRSIPFKVTSTDADIKAVRADLYVNGVYTTTINGTQALGTTDEFNFDVSKIMQSVLVSELRTNITSFAVTDAVASAKTIKLRFYEIIESGGVFTSTWAANGSGTNFLQSDNYDVVNMATQHLETLAEWTVDDNTKKLLTTRNDNNRIPRGVPFQVGYLSNENLKCFLIRRDKDLATLSSTETALSGILTSSKAIIEIPASLYSSDDVAYIDIYLLTSGDATRSITYRYKIVDNPCKFPMFWQNHLGDFDHFDFGNKQKIEVSTRNQRIKNPTLITIESTTKTKEVVETAALSAGELTFLAEVIKNHTIIYKWESAGVFLRYDLQSHSKKIADNDKLINTLQLTLRPSNEHIVQKGE